MLPKLVFSSNNILLQQYIDTFIESHNIDRHYVYHIKAEKSELSIEQIRELKREIITSSGNMKVFFLHGFDTASAEAQNALLKTLEEMQERHMFILLTGNKERVLPTIHSRVELIDLDKNDVAYLIRDETLALWNSLLKPRQFKTLESPLVTSVTKDHAVMLIDELIVLMKAEITTDPSYIKIIKYCLQKKDLLISNNLNPQLALDSVLMHIIANGH